MEPYVDWSNLMSYDLHGTWDSDNPIGSQVLAHSNLTEIDLALDLFWRVGVKPQNIVLGLGFYGRSFKLKSSSCWKPGCRFSGPGDKGPCTDTAGILSYREIQNILSKTGATSYHDKTAAVRYFVYNDNSWISYDDKETFKSKIEYANEMGLSGLMIWAIDQDDNDIFALSAVTDGVARNQSVDNFDLVDLKHIFPKDVMPADISDPHYGIITFGSGSESGELDPTNSGFGFLLAVGESHGLSQLRKREGKPEPFVFLDCPDNEFSHPINKTQKARVVCTSQDVEGYFRVKERGVEGTLVEMPDDCAPNSFARAISLEVARDQTIPESFASRSAPTSQVFEFSFDFDRLETRGDANIAVRMDATNVKGYWDALVDSPGVETRSLESRYFSALNEDWKGVFRQEDKFDWDSGTSLKIKKDLSASVFWQAAEHCPVGDEDYGEGIAAFASGNVDAEMFYSVSVVATSTRGLRTVNVKEANGFIKVTGKTDLVLGIGGMGRLDIDQAGQGNPVHKETPREYLGGHKVHAGAWWGSMNVSPYTSREYILATENGKKSVGERPDNAASFNGRLTARVESDFGNYAAIFPNTIDSDDMKRATEKRKKPIVTSARDDILYSGGGEDGSTITLGHYLTFGVSVDFVLPVLVQGQPEHWTHPVDMMVQAQTLAQWVIAKDESSKACTDFSALYFFYQFAEGEDNFGWDDQGETMFYSELTNLTTPTHLIKRGSKKPKDDWGVQFLNPNDALRMGADQFVQQHVDQSMGNIDCDNGRCTSCLDVEESRDCCGCVCMVCVWGARGDIEDCAECSSGADGIWPGHSVLKRSHSMATIGEGDGSDEVFDEDELNDLRSRVASIRLSYKEITVCDKKDLKSGLGYRYPAFPADVNKPWDGADSGKWDSISRYWGNASADCSDWTILKKATADVVHVGNGVTQRADYETDSSYPWEDPAGKEDTFSLLQLLHSELGNMAHQDRLTIALGRLNNKKQNLFGHKNTYQEKGYKRMSSDEQLQLVKEHGLLFNYMNHEDVWEMWCDTYNAMRVHLVEFDKWYPKSKGDPDVTLADEWDKYHRVALDSIVLRSRETWKWLYDNSEKPFLRPSHPKFISLMIILFASSSSLLLLALPIHDNLDFTSFIQLHWTSQYLSLITSIQHHSKSKTHLEQLSLRIWIMANRHPNAALDRIPMELLLITTEDMDREILNTMTLVCKRLRLVFLPQTTSRVTVTGNVPQMTSRLVSLLKNHPHSPSGPMSQYVKHAFFKPEPSQMIMPSLRIPRHVGRFCRKATSLQKVTVTTYDFSKVLEAQASQIKRLAFVDLQGMPGTGPNPRLANRFLNDVSINFKQLECLVLGEFLSPKFTWGQHQFRNLAAKVDLDTMPIKVIMALNSMPKLVRFAFVLSEDTLGTRNYFIGDDEWHPWVSGR
ncbi:Chitotriosidase-1 [Fusarium oxysporum f. sp. cubense]|uniref:chitinase n=1 Tax=Fusarium oxysporum f. sp. cubense TaxID=61366 RepID=A0A559LIG8_FUSOC|nr:Chitotriosidase-1 [Fusarium oxysporum f. sp. cubense]